MDSHHAIALHRVALQVVAAALSFGFIVGASAFELKVEVLNVRSFEGSIGGAVYASETAWLKNGEQLQALRAPAAGKTVLTYRDLPAGRYAISVFHDENGNGRLDVNPAGMPLERYGFSRDARGQFGPPRFADALLELQADTTITVNLR